MKTVIYLDVLLLVNFLIAWFLLLAAGAVSGQRAGAARMAAASALHSASLLSTASQHCSCRSLRLP